VADAVVAKGCGSGVPGRHGRQPPGARSLQGAPRRRGGRRGWEGWEEEAGKGAETGSARLL